MIFHCYVSSPEGIYYGFYDFMFHISATLIYNIIEHSLTCIKNYVMIPLDPLIGEKKHVRILAENLQRPSAVQRFDADVGAVGHFCGLFLSCSMPQRGFGWHRHVTKTAAGRARTARTVCANWFPAAKSCVADLHGDPAAINVLFFSRASEAQRFVAVIQLQDFGRIWKNMEELVVVS